MTGDNAGLLVVASGIASQLENFGSEILQDSGEINWGTSTDTLSIVALPQQTVDTADGESETGLGGTAAQRVRGSSDHKACELLDSHL